MPNMQNKQYQSILLKIQSLKYEQVTGVSFSLINLFSCENNIPLLSKYNVKFM
jgi:hypothetical protein